MIQGIFRSRIYTAIALVCLVLCIGVMGYHFIWNQNWIDSLYMTIITVSTVGYREVIEMDDSAKLFTIFLIVTSVSIFGYSLSVITQHLFNYRTVSEMQKKKKMKEISKLKNHVIVCGYGRNGREAAAKLKTYNKSFVVIEKELQIIEKYENIDNVLFIHGNANEDDSLEKAMIETAETLICALPNDANNLFIVLTARQQNPKLKIISRASEESSVSKLKLAGANNVVMPDHIGGDHMASLVVVPDLVEFMDSLQLEEDESPNLEEVTVRELSDDYFGKTLLDLDIQKKTGCTVIGLKKIDGQYIVNPGLDTPLQANQILIVLGNPHQIQHLKTMFGV